MYYSNQKLAFPLVGKAYHALAPWLRRAAGPGVKAIGKVPGGKSLKNLWEEFTSLHPTRGTKAIGNTGVTYQTLPQVLKDYFASPGKALKGSWKAMGPHKGPIKGLEKRPEKFLPSFKREGVASAAYPSLNRLFFAGSAAPQVAAAIKTKDPKRRAQLLGAAAGGLPAWVMSSRMRFLPSMATWLGGEALGTKAGKFVGGQ